MNLLTRYLNKKEKYVIYKNKKLQRFQIWRFKIDSTFSDVVNIVASNSLEYVLIQSGLIKPITNSDIAYDTSHEIPVEFNKYVSDAVVANIILENAVENNGSYVLDANGMKNVWMQCYNHVANMILYFSTEEALKTKKIHELYNIAIKKENKKSKKSSVKSKKIRK